MKYEMNVTISGTVTIDAETEDQAHQFAYDAAESFFFGCRGCNADVESQIAMDALVTLSAELFGDWDDDNLIVEPNG